MADQDYNLQLDSQANYQAYQPFAPLDVVNIDSTAPGGAVTTINGDAGAGAAGPVVVLSGGATGYQFTAAGSSITMTGDVAAVLAALGLSKNNAASTAPTVNDDLTQGYSINSLWTDDSGPASYICQKAAVGAAIWQLLS